MDLLLAKGAVVSFLPDSGWQWDAWDGKLTIECSWNVSLSDSDIVLKSDLESLKRKLIGKAYKASGFESSPGNIVEAVIEIDTSSLSNVLECSDEAAATMKTNGAFRVNCVPSLNSVAAPDPVTSKSGKWKIESSAQAIASST